MRISLLIIINVPNHINYLVYLFARYVGNMAQLPLFLLAKFVKNFILIIGVKNQKILD